MFYKNNILVLLKTHLSSIITIPDVFNVRFIYYNRPIHHLLFDKPFRIIIPT